MGSDGENGKACPMGGDDALLMTVEEVIHWRGEFEDNLRNPEASGVLT